MKVKNRLSLISKGLFGRDLFGFERDNYLFEDGQRWQAYGDSNSILSFTDLTLIENAYYKCPMLQTVIVNKAQASINATVKIVNAKGKEVDTPESKAIIKKMAQPNFSQTYKLFRMESKIYVNLYGYHFVWYQKNLIGGKNNIWNLNPALTVTKFKIGKFYQQTNFKDCIEYIKYWQDGLLIDIPLDEVILVKDTVNTKTNKLIANPPLFPTSRVVGIEMVVSNNIAAYNARNSMVTTRGGMGFISPDSKDSASAIPLLENDIDDMKRQQSQDYGVLRHQSKFIYSSKGIKFQAISMSTRELMLFEETEQTDKQIVNVFGYKWELLASDKGTTFTNQKEAKKAFYQDTIIPEDSVEIPALWSGWTEIAANGWKVETDYSHVEALREDEMQSEDVNSKRIANIKAINDMTVDYPTKLNIATTTLNISEQEAKLLIYDGQTETTNPAANQTN